MIGAYVSETLASYILPAATDIAAQLRHHEQIPLAVAFVVVAAWVAAFLAAGLWRVLRDEY